MPSTQRSQFSDPANIVEECYCEARIDALNHTLLERGISTDRVIAILPVPGQTMVNPTADRFRVLYRTT
jgi:hypothetical protein